VAVAGEIAEKRIEGRDAPGVASVRDIVQSGGSEEAVNDSEVDLADGTDPLLPAKQPKRVDIAGVGGAGVVGEAALGSQVVKVALKQRLERMLQVGGDVRSEKRWDSIRHAGCSAPYIARRSRLNLRSLRRASACLRRFLMLGFS
jgi:hypothetical protein